MGQCLYFDLLPQITGPLHLKGLEAELFWRISGIVYLIFALPAAFYGRRFGYKAAIMFGLGCLSVGCFTFYPAVTIHAHAYFFIAVAAMALGWIFLEVSANPLAASLGPDETFVWRLNFAQTIYPLGTMAAVFFAQWLPREHTAVLGEKLTFLLSNPYILLGGGVLLIAYLFEEKRFPPVAIERTSGGEGAALRTLLSDRLVLFAMAAQGIGIIILVTSSAEMIGGRYLNAAFHLQLPAPLNDVYVWTAVVFAVGRLVGSTLMRFIAPRRLLAAFAIGGCVCSLVAAVGWTMLSGITVMANQFFASIMWPTILGIAIRGKGSLIRPATALVCIGGALAGEGFPLLMTAWPTVTAQLGMIIPAVCFTAIFGFACFCGRRDAKAAHLCLASDAPRDAALV